MDFEERGVIMKGYIGITSREWFTYFSNNDRINEVDFWRKNINNLMC
jgi:hypothetical protein